MSSQRDLIFKVTSTKIITFQKSKFVLYTILIRSSRDDPHPAMIERRYSDFLTFYNTLKEHYPALMESVQFPKKAISGNFSPLFIFHRSQGFLHFLNKVVSVRLLRDSEPFRVFLQEKEMSMVLRFIETENYDAATHFAGNCFHLMNKVQTSRSPTVLKNLCLFVSLCEKSGDGRSLNMASLAVRRYQSVSDYDLLKYYVPLLNIGLELSKKFGKDYSPIVDELETMKRRGITCHATKPLLELIVEDLTPKHMSNAVPLS